MANISEIVQQVRRERGVGNPSYPMNWKPGDSDPCDSQTERDIQTEALRRLRTTADSEAVPLNL